MPESIVKLTSNAINHIRKNIDEQHALGFRIAVKKTGCSGYAYVPDIIHEKKADDIEYQIEDILVWVDKSSVPFLQGTVIDFVDSGLGQTKLVFHNPNAGNLCGCGESFNLPEE
jgi:iron-sulfur cluster assembly accessory protein